MMLNIVYLVFAVSIASLNAEVISKKNFDIYLRNLKELHNGPPINETGAINRAITTRWFYQSLDNFNSDDKRAWRMRYMVNADHYVEGGPIFINVGGEWTIKNATISQGHFYDIAKKHNAILFYTEHRFYGESQPFGNYTSENLKYLNVKQAIADLKSFIEHQSKDLKTSKIILYGCSYAGTIVTWLKRLHPDLISGGWVSSAPLLAKADFSEYKIMVAKAFKVLGGAPCYKRIEDAFTEFQNMIDHNRTEELNDLMHTSYSFDNIIDKWSFFDTMSSKFLTHIQYQRDDDVAHLCRNLTHSGLDALHSVAHAIHNYWKPHNTKLLKEEDDIGVWSWFYQTCHEFGWFTTANDDLQPFGRTLIPYFLGMCEQFYGIDAETVNARINQTNLDFGSRKPAVSNIYTVHGSLDPWSTIGLSAEDGATFIPNASHCPDTQSISPYDSEEMRASKQRIEQLIGEWLN